MSFKKHKTHQPSYLLCPQDLSDRLREEASRTADAIAAADTARQQQHVMQAELAAAQATARMVPGLQGELSKARTAAESASSQVDAMRCEADGLRAALHAVEGRLTEYQEKDTEV
jgi:chromosome segregation ATPase